MFSNQRSRGMSGLLVVPVACLLIGASHAAAQPQEKRPKPDGPPADVLRGPNVDDNSVPGQRNRFGGGNARDRGQGRDATPARMFVQALGVLRGQDAPADTRLTADQEASLKKLHEQFRADQRAFAEKHRDEVLELRRQVSPENRRKIDQRLRGMPGFAGLPGGQGDRKGDKPLGRPDRSPRDEMNEDSMQEMSAKDDAAAMNRLREIAEQAPDPATLQTKSWAVLSAPQKELVEQELKRLREAGAKRGDAQPGDPGRLPPGVIGDDGKVDLSKLPPRLRERIEKLPPDQREKALQRLIEQNRAREGKKGAPRTGQRPAPDMDDVNVPSPDSAPERR